MAPGRVGHAARAKIAVLPVAIPITCTVRPRPAFFSTSAALHGSCPHVSSPSVTSTTTASRLGIVENLGRLAHRLGQRCPPTRVDGLDDAQHRPGRIARRPHAQSDAAAVVVGPFAVDDETEPAQGSDLGEDPCHRLLEAGDARHFERVVAGGHRARSVEHDHRVRLAGVRGRPRQRLHSRASRQGLGGQMPQRGDGASTRATRLVMSAPLARPRGNIGLRDAGGKPNACLLGRGKKAGRRA